MPVSGRVTIAVRNTVRDAVRSLLLGFDSRLLVGIHVELDEQEQVAGQNGTPEQGS
jgi:hypothetical protein